MKSRKLPLVSVIIPVFNAEKYLHQAIQSILNQTYKNIELILVDDYSTDKSSQIINFFASNYQKKIKRILLRKNLGESAAANQGFKASSGEFIARMDADDVSYPERIEKQVNFLVKNPDVVVLGTQSNVINSEGKVIGEKTFPRNHADIYKLYGICNPMLHPSCMFRRALLPNKEKLYENLKEPNDDYFTLFRLLGFGKFANLEEALVSYRLHDNNKSLQNPKQKIFNAFKIRITAVRDLNYKPSPYSYLVNLVYFIGALIIPERLIVPMYMFIRGMNKTFLIPKKVFPQITSLYPKYISQE